MSHTYQQAEAARAKLAELAKDDPHLHATGVQNMGDTYVVMVHSAFAPPIAVEHGAQHPLLANSIDGVPIIYRWGHKPAMPREAN